MQQDLFYEIEVRDIPEKVKYIQEYDLPKVDYTRQKHVSFSQMNVYKGCQYRWKLEYKDGLRKFTSTSHTTFGTAIHETLQSYLDVLYNESEKKAEDLDLHTIFKNNFIAEYEKQVKANDGTHYITQSEFEEFYDDGLNIIDCFKAERYMHFAKDKIHLVGCEVPLTLSPDENKPNVKYIGFLDVVIYNEDTKKFKIIDIKTSTRGWFKWALEDESKHNQLYLYKKFFARQYDVSEQDIDIEFFILKRKLPQKSNYPQSNIQLFEPINQDTDKALGVMTSFINECFDSKAEYVEREYPKMPSKNACRFCPYSDDDELCGEGSKL